MAFDRLISCQRATGLRRAATEFPAPSMGGHTSTVKSPPILDYVTTILDRFHESHVLPQQRLCK